jgi:capsular exopolysaccharide synthesis family protein
MGIFGGVGLCFIFEYFDNTIKGPEDVEKLAGIPSIGVIPLLEPYQEKKKDHPKRKNYLYSYDGKNEQMEDSGLKIRQIELVNLFYPKYSVSEDYRTVRTSIMLSNADTPPRTIVFTSSLPGEGKSATVANLAVSFSHLGKRVLMIDADMRKPRLHQIFRARMNRGLSGYLTGKVPIEEAIQKTGIENVWLMPSGLIPPNPAELLGSTKMRVYMEAVKKGFDYVFIDSPPLWAVVDALVLGSVADSVVLIVQPEKTAQKPFLKAVGELRKGKARILGVVFNQVKGSRKDYLYYMDYYRRYGPHYHSGEGGEASEPHR